MQIPQEDHSLPLWHQDTKKGEHGRTESLILIVFIIHSIIIRFLRSRLRTRSIRSRDRAGLSRITMPVGSKRRGVADLHLKLARSLYIVQIPRSNRLHTHPRCNITTKVNLLHEWSKYKVFYYKLHMSRLAQSLAAEMN